MQAWLKEVNKMKFYTLHSLATYFQHKFFLYLFRKSIEKVNNISS